MSRLELAASLAVVTVVGMMFSSTRQLGLLCLAVLCVLYPWPMAALLLMGGGAFLFLTYRKRK